MATKPPDAFLSYTRFDDQHDRGAISQFRLRLASAVRAVTGEPFDIFQDVDGIGRRGPSDLPVRVAATLGRWTGRPWLVMLADDTEAAQPTLAEQARDRER